MSDKAGNGGGGESGSDTRDAALSFKVSNVDHAQRRVVAWGYMVAKADGTPTTDTGGTTKVKGKVVENATDQDVIDTPECLKQFENKFYDFISSGKAGADDMHVDFDVARIVGGMFFTPEVSKALGVPDNSLPTGAVIVVDVPRTPRGDLLWSDIVTGKKRELSMVSRVYREEVEDAA